MHSRKEPVETQWVLLLHLGRLVGCEIFERFGSPIAHEIDNGPQQPQQAGKAACARTLIVCLISLASEKEALQRHCCSTATDRISRAYARYGARVVTYY